MRASERAPRNSQRVFERLHALAEIAERGAVVLTIRLRWIYARSLYLNDGATLDDLREAVTTLEELERITRRVFGDAHPLTTQLEQALRDAQAALSARETQSSH